MSRDEFDEIVKKSKYAQKVLEDAEKYGMTENILNTAFDMWQSHSQYGIETIMEEAAMYWDI